MIQLLSMVGKLIAHPTFMPDCGISLELMLQVVLSDMM